MLEALRRPENAHLLEYVTRDPFGAHVFPGGALHEGDRSATLAAHVRVDARPWPGSQDRELDRMHALAVVRETLEEVGLLLGCDALESERLARLRAEVRAGANFAELVATHALDLDLSVLTPLVRWITPRRSANRRSVSRTASPSSISGDSVSWRHVPGSSRSGGSVSSTSRSRRRSSASYS